MNTRPLHAILTLGTSLTSSTLTTTPLSTGHIDITTEYRESSKGETKPKTAAIASSLVIGNHFVKSL